MIEHGAVSVASSSAVDVGTVWVLARHLLVAQAIAAGLDGRIDDVRTLMWGQRVGHQSHATAERDLLLVVDDLGSPAAVTSVRSLLDGSPCRALVITRAARGDVWGALLSSPTTEVIQDPVSVDVLVDAVARVSAGEPLVPPEERAELCERWERHLVEEQELLERMQTLSARELLVLHALAAGRRPAEIGEDLGVAQSTVRTHIRSIRRKLDVDSQMRAVLVVHRLRARVPSALDVPSPRAATD